MKIRKIYDNLDLDLYIEVFDMIVKEMLDKHGEEIWREKFKDFVTIEDLNLGDKDIFYVSD